MKSTFNAAPRIAPRAHAVLLTIIVAVALLAGGATHAAVNTYMFRDSLAPVEGSGNTLVATFNNGAFVNGSFVDTTIDASVCSGTPTVRGWSFPQFGGLRTPNNTPAIVGGSYTISMIVKFNPMISGYSRLIDFSNSTLDTGIYELDGGLSLYPVGTFAPGSFVNNVYSFVTFTRDAATNVVSVFVGITPAGTYTDTTGLYVPSAQNVIFMMDNTTGSAAITESSSGIVTYLKLIDTPVTAAQIPALQAEACSTVVAPTVTGINPPSGPMAGGTSVTITGSKFTGATAVKFGANNATAFTVDSDTQITATSPAGAAGTVDVTITTASGTSAIGANDRFTYLGVIGPSLPIPTLSETATWLLAGLLALSAALWMRRRKKQV
ncbi:MAG: IPTL-CTERM sorting domain-containing protein [Casimicrobiaceae bacterium]